MPVFGRFETLQELSRTGLNCVWSAKLREGAKPRQDFAVKEFRPAVQLLTRDSLAPLVDAFHERAHTQKLVNDGGAKNWARIHEAEKTEEGAYYATDLYPRSAQKLIRGRIKLSAPALHHLISSVVAGLSEIDQLAGRSHGNLKPSNVLISGEGPIEQSRVVLTDPAPLQDVLMHGGEAADLRALGELIYSLVLHKPFEFQTPLPLSSSRDWSRLGSSGKAWLDLCNRLLGQDPDTMMAGLAGVRAELARMKTRGGLPWKALAAVLLIAVLAAAAASGWMYLQYRRQWQALQGMSGTWVAQLAGAAELQSQRDLLARDPHLKQKVLPELSASGDDAGMLGLEQIAPPGREGTSRLSPPLSYHAMRKTRQALSRIERLRTALSPVQWPTLRRWQDRLQEDQDKRLGAPAKYLAWLLADLDLDRPGGNLMRGVERLIYLDTDGKPAFDQLEAKAIQLQKARDAMETAKDDPILGQFGRFVEDRIAGVLSRAAGSSSSGRGAGLAADLLGALVEQTAELASLGDELSGAVRREWAGIDRQRLAADTPATTGPAASTAALSAQAFRDRIVQARAYRPVPDRQRQIVDELSKLRDAAAGNLKTFQGLAEGDPGMAASAKALKTRLDDASRHIGDLATEHLVEKDLQAKPGAAIREELSRVAADIGMAMATTTGNPQEWLEHVRSIGARHERINAAWQERLNALLGDRGPEQLGKDPVAFHKLRTQVDAWQKALLELDGRFPPMPAEPELFKAAATGKWQTALTTAISAISDHDGMPQPAWDKVDQAINEYKSFQAELADLARQHDELAALLQEGYGPDEAPQSGQPTPAQREQTLLASPLARIDAVAAAIQPLQDRVDHLRQASGWNRQQAIEAIDKGAGSRPELVVAGLRRLLAGPVPESSEQLEQEARLRAELDRVLRSSIRSDSRVKALSKELASNGPERWVAFFTRNISGPSEQRQKQVLTALSSAEPFGITAQTPLPAWIRYDMRLAAFQQGLADEPPGTSKSELIKLGREFLNQVPAELLNRAAVQGIRSDIDAFDRSTPPQGPPAPTWKLARSDSTGRSYEWRIDSETVRTLSFLLVRPQSGTPFYLATTEVPLSLFLDLAGSDAELKQRLIESLDRQPLGPRGWERVDGDVIRKSRYWLPDLRLPPQKFLYYPEIQSPSNHWALKDREADPVASHPVQQISPLAAAALANAVGCRLPTPAEWLAAYAKYESGGGAAQPPGTRNLRDQVWARQFQYLQTLNLDPSNEQALRPDAGIFLPEGFNDADHFIQNLDDHTLWFQKIGADGERPMHQLVGNVAEYVRDEPGGTFYVIGGSALSPPEMPVDKPYPLSATQYKSCWSDVGVRLAFPQPGSDLDRFRQMILAQRFLQGAGD